jgi:hypothetical protein
LTLVGLVLVGTKFAADMALQQVKDKAFNNTNVGDIQHSLTDFAKLVESHIVNFDMYVGVAFLAAALIIFIVLLSTRNRGGKKKAGHVERVSNSDMSGQATTSTADHPSVASVTGGQPTRPGGAAPSAPRLPDKSSAPKPKRPRLIQ